MGTKRLISNYFLRKGYSMKTLKVAFLSVLTLVLFTALTAMTPASAAPFHTMRAGQGPVRSYSTTNWRHHWHHHRHHHGGSGINIHL